MVVCDHGHHRCSDGFRRSFRLLEEDAQTGSGFGQSPPRGGTICPPLALEFATVGGLQKIQCWNTEGIFRLIQSIPSAKAEPLKRWLARVGKERIDEIENPELAMSRMQELYEKKGYPKEWIDKRLRGTQWDRISPMNGRTAEPRPAWSLPSRTSSAFWRTRMAVSSVTQPTASADCRGVG